MSLENLERDDPAIREGDGLVRHRDARRYVGIKERIEEWIADKHKGAVMEMVHAVGTDESKSYTNPAVNSRAARIRIARGVGDVDPGLGRSPAHVADDFMFR